MSTMQPTLTRGQTLVLEVLRHEGIDNTAPDLWNAHEIAEDLERYDPGGYARYPNWTYSRVHAILVRLAKRGLVERLQNRHMADDWRIV